jgi:zinc ribbon family protein
MDDVTFVVGQLAGPGTYQCQTCGAERKEYALSFEIEPCGCGGTTFRRTD